MPTKTARKGAAKDKRSGKKASTQAGNYVKQEMLRLKKGTKNKPKNRKQAIAIGLAEAPYLDSSLPLELHLRQELCRQARLDLFAPSRS